MPFINTKVSTPMTEAQKEKVKSRLGKAITLIPGKSENWLMVGFEDNYDLYFKGNKDEATAFIEVKVFGTLSQSTIDDMTKEVCKIMKEELQVPSERVYVKYEEASKWGWNNSNF